ncbi:GNAT family N-acetyltransferase [Aminobacter sp. MDW-2]|uniref:GNAT family N-acetyltransferase n=1 Tax=Aminobacter sp. MDW-2 TaxID=2666139 RepID=UPI0012AF857C|nr:GNAT family N-acetyltransferase [Aminobacter sp. MDW-2]MRX37539.1 GNAT family N-acetyltransferase [Aminobacter sp. MDW-2]QNH36471.1 GNAT family N-acetyltransferase [Aminobacter sp. MDW-2]
MQVDVITDVETLAKLRQDWERLYKADPEAQFFVSWAWLVPYMRFYKGAWFVLAARLGNPGSPYVALMPLRMRTRMSGKTGLFFNEISMAGNNAADYTGAICDPVHAEMALKAFGRHVAQMGWARLNLENLRMSRERVFAFIGQFSRDIFAMREFSRVNAADNVDNCRCFAAALPDTFDGYLDNVLSTNTRQKLRRFLRKVDAGELRITRADADTYERDIDTLLDLWRIKWGARKGDRLAAILHNNRRVLRDSFRNGTLYLPVLWQGDRPLGGLAIFVDPVKKALLFFMAGRDEAVTSVPTGLILHGHCIKLAIENGLTTYDFLRGDEPYKFAFGVTESKINCAQIYTKSGRNNGDRLDTRSLNGIFAEVTRLHQQGQLERAESGYRQILATDASHSRALYGIGQLLSAKGEHREALAHYQTLANSVPTSAKAWLRLGMELQALSRHIEAAEAFRKVLSLSPDFAGAEFSLAKSLAALDRIENAIETLEALEHKLEAASRDDTLLAKTRIMLKRLKLESRPSYIMLNPDRKSVTRVLSSAL